MSVRLLKLMLLLLITGLLMVSASPPAHASGAACSDVFQGEMSIEKVLASQNVSAALIRYLALHPEIPAFVKQTNKGPMPVILMTVKSHQLLLPLVDRSIGSMVQLQPTWHNDHGEARVSDMIIDVDTPGARGYGEIHKTGLAWKEVKSYVSRRVNGGSDTLVEVAFPLSEDDLATSVYYQKMRRAAILRVPFTFVANNFDPNQPNAVTAGEHCFVFCQGSAIGSHISEIKSKMRELGVADVDAFMASDEVKTYLARARQTLLRAPYNDANKLSWNSVNTPNDVNSLAQVLPPQLNLQNRRVLLNWIVALDASSSYETLRRRIGLGRGGGFNDMESPGSAFVLIYDNQKTAAAFADASFQTRGKFYTWSPNGQTPIKQAK